MRQSASTLFLVALFAILCFSEAPGQYAWTKSPSPVLTPAALGNWYKEVWSPSILFNPDSSRYEMWFSAGPGPELNWQPYQIAFATSKDALTWNVVGTGPVLTSIPGTWEANVCNPFVLREGGTYKMWYTAFRAYSTTDSAYIAYATSADGIHWTRYAGNPLMRPGPAAWEYKGIGGVTVIHRGTVYEMWYDGSSLTNWNLGSIGRATSPDGINWTKDIAHNPVLVAGTSGQWDQGAMGFPRIFSIADTMFMCYTAIQSNGDFRRIGLARSTDGGTTWLKHGTGPILSPGPAGSWDQQFVQEGFVLVIRDTLHMWYLGMSYNPVGGCIGHATSPLKVTDVADRDAGIPGHFVLEQNYPNPFNPTTTIRYGLPWKTSLQLAVFNALGQQVALLAEGEQEAGYHEIVFNATGLSSGMYFYRVQASGASASGGSPENRLGYAQTRRFLLLR